MAQEFVAKTIRFLPEINSEIERLAKEDERSFAWMVNHLLKSLLKDANKQNIKETQN